MGKATALWSQHSSRFMFLAEEWTRLKREHANENAAMAAYHVLCGEQTERWRREDQSA